MEIALTPGIEEHKWRNEKEKIDAFITSSKHIVDALYDIVRKMLDSLKKIRESLEKFNVKIIERRNKPSSPDEYDSYLKAIFVNKLNTVKEQGQLIHKQLKEVLDSVKADKKGLAWRNYNDYVNTIVIDGIATSIQTALRHLNEQIACSGAVGQSAPSTGKKDNLGALFDIKLELTDHVSFEPEIG
jgi:dynein heavy chain, axonemal